MAQKRDDSAVRKAMQDQRERVNKANEEAMKRVAESRPTPTQEENDLARMGIHVETKEDDKSGENVIVEKTLVAGQPVGPHGYDTRAARAKGP